MGETKRPLSFGRAGVSVVPRFYRVPVDFVVTMAVGPRTQSFVVPGADEVEVRELLRRHAEQGDRQFYRSVNGDRVDVVWRNVVFPNPVDITPVPNS